MDLAAIMRRAGFLPRDTAAAAPGGGGGGQNGGNGTVMPGRSAAGGNKNGVSVPVRPVPDAQAALTAAAQNLGSGSGLRGVSDAAPTGSASALSPTASGSAGGTLAAVSSTLSLDDPMTGAPTAASAVSRIASRGGVPLREVVGDLAASDYQVS